MEFIIIILGLFLDRVSKLWALKSLKGTEGIVLIKDFFAFDYLENRGAAFGILQNKLIFLTLITLVVLGGILFYLFYHKPKSVLVRISLSLVVSGALGNLYDRIFYKYVVDFILVHYKDVYYFPTFNVADMMVVVGTALFAWCIIRGEE